MHISADFPGGNIVVRRIEGNRIYLSPDLRDTTWHWFYWAFDIRFEKTGEYEFFFDMLAVGTRGPAISFDGGLTWQWGGGIIEGEEGFRYNHDGDISTVRFCMGIPYLQSNWERFCKLHNLSYGELCKSRSGRSVEFLKLGNGPNKFLFAARHHCCEMAANYVMEGIIESAIQDENRDFTLFAVPFVDKDGVENGDQGKARKPHDHARDYVQNPIYPEVKAMMELVCAEKPGVVMDLHCPSLRGGDANETIYIVGMEGENVQLKIDRFAEILEEETHDNIPRYLKSDNVLFGTSWNTSENYSDGKTLPMWCSTLAWSPLVCPFEIPYANVRDVTMSPDLWRNFGRAVWAACGKYVKHFEITEEG